MMKVMDVIAPGKYAMVWNTMIMECMQSLLCFLDGRPLASRSALWVWVPARRAPPLWWALSRVSRWLRVRGLLPDSSSRLHDGGLFPFVLGPSTLVGSS